MDGQPHPPRPADGRRGADQPVSHRGRSWLVLSVKIAVAAAIIAWLCTGRLDVGRLVRVPLSLDLGLLTAIVFGSMFLPAVRWWWLLRVQRIEVSLWRVIALTWVGYATALVLPGAASGDVAKSLLILRGQREARARSLSTVLVDRIVGVYSLVLLGCVSAGWFVLSRPASPAVWLIFYAMVALSVGLTPVVAGVIFASPPRWIAGKLPLAWAESWRESNTCYRGAKRAVAGCLLLSLTSSAAGGRLAGCRRPRAGRQRKLDSQSACRAVGGAGQLPAVDARRAGRGRGHGQ